MNFLEKIFLTESRRSRAARAEIFRRKFRLDETTRILDIGSESGENIHFVLKDTKILPRNVYIADIEQNALDYGREKFGFQTILLDESGVLPFEDQSFDLIYCSSVIEHVTVPKDEIWKIENEKKFKSSAWRNQKKFADEIRRVGKNYFVQTPNRRFVIESHSWLPLVGFLKRSWMLKFLRLSNKYWIKIALPDFNLLDKNQLQQLFPEAEIISEKRFGLVKSITAIKV